jgi:hypothetical protein
LPQKKWFLAIYLLPQLKKSTLELYHSRERGVNYNPAWKVKLNLMQLMLKCDYGKKVVRADKSRRCISEKGESRLTWMIDLYHSSYSAYAISLPENGYGLWEIRKINLNTTEL